MNTSVIGNNFYNMLMDMGEDYTITTLDGGEFTGKLSITTQKYSRLMEEREYLLQGVATFPDLESQEKFRGCYFTRNIDFPNTYIMISVIPEPTDERIGSVYCVECNAIVTLANLEMQTDEKGDTIAVPVPYAEDIKVYFDTTLQKQRKSSDGNFENTKYYMQMPAHYGIMEDQVVIKKSLMWDDEEKGFKLKDRRYRVESVTTSMTRMDADGNIYGICDVQMSIDTRG